MKIADYRIHGNYIGELPLYNDIALIKTSGKVGLIARSGLPDPPGIASCVEYSSGSPDHLFRFEFSERREFQIIFHEFVGPVCLPPVAKRSNFSSEEAIVTGWGRTNFTRWVYTPRRPLKLRER